MIRKSAMTLAQASNGNPIISTVTVMLFYLAFNLLAAVVEVLAFGARFEHWLDPAFILAFIAYGAYSVCACAEYNTVRHRGTNP